MQSERFAAKLCSPLRDNAAHLDGPTLYGGSGGGLRSQWGFRTHGLASSSNWALALGRRCGSRLRHLIRLLGGHQRAAQPAAPPLACPRGVGLGIHTTAVTYYVPTRRMEDGGG